MRRRIVQSRGFNKKLNNLVAKRRLFPKDFENFLKKLVENPEIGKLIVGTGGVRKIRLKSSSKGKSSGFRVCYFNDSKREELFLILIYQKNEQDDLTMQEKKILKDLTKMIKAKKYE